MMRRRYKPDVVLADIPRVNDPVEFKLADVPTAEKLEKFLEDVKWVLAAPAVLSPTNYVLF